MVCVLPSVASAQSSRRDNSVVPAIALDRQRAVKDPVLTFANGWRVSREEFEQVFRKHLASTRVAATPQEARRYLDLYIDFCRKVMEAERLGLDTTQEYRDEFGAYVKQLAQTFLVEKELVDHLVDEAIVRSFYQVHASHLLIQLPPDAAPRDTLTAWRRVMALRDSILQTNRPLAETFGDYAARYSDEPGANNTRGDLGYFSVFEMVYPFETVAYLTPQARVSMPVRTQFGYHLIYVHNRMPNQQGRTVAHLFVASGDSAQAIERLSHLRRRLEGGDSFAALARCCSDDARSAAFGGVISEQRLLPELERVRAQLQVGQVSHPFRSRRGWHLLKVLEETPPVSEASRRTLYRSQVIQDGRVKRAELALVEGLKRRLEYREVDRAPRLLAQSLGTKYLTLGPLDLVTLDKQTLKLPLFTFADQTIRFGDLLRQRSQRPYNSLSAVFLTQSDLEGIIRMEIRQLAHRVILDWESRQLPARYPEFRALAREYHDGILLFTLMERNVWRRAAEDSVGLRNYFDAQRQRFASKPQLHLVQITSNDSLTLRTVVADFRYRHSVPQAVPQAGSQMQLAATQNQVMPTSQLPLQNEGLQQLQTLERTVPAALMDSTVATRMIAGGPGHCEPVQAGNGQYSCECVLAVLPAPNLNFEALRGELLRSYQAKLERDWLNELARRYPVRVHEKVLARIVAD